MKRQYTKILNYDTSHASSKLTISLWFLFHIHNIINIAYSPYLFFYIFKSFKSNNTKRVHDVSYCLLFVNTFSIYKRRNSIRKSYNRLYLGSCPLSSLLSLFLYYYLFYWLKSKFSILFILYLLEMLLILLVSWVNRFIRENIREWRAGRYRLGPCVRSCSFHYSFPFKYRYENFFILHFLPILPLFYIL